MQRRALLSLATVGLAGCGGVQLVSPQDAGVQPAQSDCPASDTVASVVCVPETDPSSIPVSLTADSRSGSLPATFTLTLKNGSVRGLSTNFYSWRLWKRVDGTWHHIVPGMIPQPLMQLSPTDTHEWTLTVEHQQPRRTSRYYRSWKDAGTVGGLGGGPYAFTIDGWFGDGNHDSRIQFGVLLDFDAPRLAHEPTTNVTGSSRDGDTVTVRGEGSDSDEARPAEFVLERADEVSEPRTLIPEQAVHDYRLRNTLPYFEQGVETVRYVADDATWPAFGVNEAYSIRYDGKTFSISANELVTETETA